MTTETRSLILVVDDEPNLLEALERHLRRNFEVVTAPGGPAALEVLARRGPFAVVLSDMRMPEMDGVTFLKRVRELRPDTVRMLLTGQGDFQTALAAINHGHVFRFLTKPCPSETLLTALQDADAQYRLITAERVLLEHTLHGCVKTLVDLLALASPTAFGRATRAKKLTAELALRLGVPQRWPLEVATMLSQIGCIVLPPQTAESLYRGTPMSEAESAMVDRLPEVADRLLAPIPRMEPVREILAHHACRWDGGGKPPLAGEAIPLGARLLKVAFDLDQLETEGTPASALETIRGRQGWYDPAVVKALLELRGVVSGEAIREMPLREVRIGMTFARDVVTKGGMMLVARGQEVTEALLSRLRNFATTYGVREPLRMIVPSA